MCGELKCDRLLTLAHADPIETSYLPSAPRGAMACGVARVKGAAEDRAIAVRAIAVQETLRLYVTRCVAWRDRSAGDASLRPKNALWPAEGDLWWLEELYLQVAEDSMVRSCS